ncbi:hypothetical protein BDC45DRAFT_420169, partial [Circinella umbellata]
QVIRVHLEKLPIIPCDALEPGLRSCLSPYGNVLQMCLYEEPSRGWFGGRGFAILGRLPNIQYADLTHRMCWNNSDTENTRSFFATWADMGVYCRYCHETTH